MNSKCSQVGSSMDMGSIYKIDNKYFKVTIEPINASLVQNFEQADSLDLAVYHFTPCSKPKYFELKLLDETPAVYETRVKNKIKPIDLSNIKFQEIIYQDEDIIMGPDIKHKPSAPYYIIFVLDENLCSMRDLNSSHLNLLHKIKNVGLTYVAKRENVSTDELRMYCHYYPSIWRLHIHVNLVRDKHESTSIDYTYKLFDIIQNISFCPDFYQVATLCTISKFNPLLTEDFVALYIKKYVKSASYDDFVFQETIRLRDVKELANNRNGVLHGRVAWEYIQQIFSAANISCSFKEYIASVSESAQMEFNILTNLNYRRLIRKILMYPYVTYSMFESFDNIDRTEIISRANKFKSNLSIKKIDGRIYATLVGFNDFMWELEIDQLLHMRVEKLDQDCDRIHLIHSDIVNQCPESDLAEFLGEYQNLPYDLEFCDVYHTYSADWFAFSVCVVITLKSRTLNYFISQFNERFGKRAGLSNPSLHRTIGVVYR